MQRVKSRVIIAGPTTLWSILNSLQMGFHTLAIQKRSSEVWSLLAAVKTEWTKYGEVLEGVQKKLHQAFTDGYSGLRQAMVCVSFLDPETEAERPEAAIAKLWNAPATLPWDSSTSYEDLRSRLIQFFLLAPKPVRARFLKESAQTMQHIDNKSEKLRPEASVAGCLYRVSFDAGSPPNIAEWRNTLLHCSERLRRHFSPERLERVTFTAIPSSEQEYKVEAELLFPKIPRVYRERSELCFRSRPRPTRKVSGVISFQAETGRPEHKLSPPEKIALDKFDELDTRERLQLWNKHLSKFYK